MGSVWRRSQRGSSALTRTGPGPARSADADYQRRGSIATGTTSTPYRNCGTDTVDTEHPLPPGHCQRHSGQHSAAPQPCPCRRSPRPDGRLATRNRGNARTHFIDRGILDNHCLTSRALWYDSTTAPVFLFSGDLPGQMGRCFRTGPPHLSDPGLAGIRPLLQAAALHHARSPIPSHVDDGRSITVTAPSHHDVGSLKPRSAATKSPRYKWAGTGRAGGGYYWGNAWRGSCRGILQHGTRVLRILRRTRSFGKFQIGIGVGWQFVAFQYFQFGFALGYDVYRREHSTSVDASGATTSTTTSSGLLALQDVGHVRA